MTNKEINPITGYEKIIEYVFKNGEKLIEKEIRKLNNIPHYVAWDSADRLSLLLDSLPVKKDNLMTNKEILKQYLGDEVFEKFDSMANQDTYEHSSPRHCVMGGFYWDRSPEGGVFWREIAIKLEGLGWKDLLTVRQISKEEHKLLLQMFLAEYMGWIVTDTHSNHEYLNKIFDLVWEE